MPGEEVHSPNGGLRSPPIGPWKRENLHKSGSAARPDGHVREPDAPSQNTAAPGLSPGKRDAAQVSDDGEHELATCYAVENLGLVVIASCSHSGVLNCVRQAQAVSGISKVHAVVGGFHLVRPRTEDEARRTIAEFAQINPIYIVPMHCTGEVFIAEALRRMPEKVIRPYVGNKLVFGAA